MRFSAVSCSCVALWPVVCWLVVAHAQEVFARHQYPPSAFVGLCFGFRENWRWSQELLQVRNNAVFLLETDIHLREPLSARSLHIYSSADPRSDQGSHFINRRSALCAAAEKTKKHLSVCVVQTIHQLAAVVYA